MKNLKWQRKKLSFRLEIEGNQCTVAENSSAQNHILPVRFFFMFNPLMFHLEMKKKTQKILLPHMDTT